MATFRQRGKKWYYRIDTYDDDGNRDQIERGGFRTKKDAEIAALKVESELLAGINLDSGSVSFADYFLEWFETYKEGHFSRDTDNLYKRHHQAISWFFGKKPINKVTRSNMQKFMNDYGLGKDKGDEPRAKSTVQKLKNTVNLCLEAAVYEGAIRRNPMFEITINKNLAEQKESEKFLNESEVIKLIEELFVGIRYDFTSRYMILIAIATGARFSEVSALTTDCINYKEKYIKINKSWDARERHGFKDTKNKSSERIIPIDQDTMDILKDYLAHKKVMPMNNLVFGNSIGRPPSNKGVNKALRKAQERVGINEPITFHGLRHTHASLLLLHNVNIVYVSKRLGHSDITTTAKVYSHLLKELDERGNVISNEMMKSLYA